MAKRILLAVVGAAMGGLVGLLVSALGAGAVGIIASAIAGALVFALGVPALADRHGR